MNLRHIQHHPSSHFPQRINNYPRIGFTVNMAGCVGAVVVGRLVDRVRSRIKYVVVACLVGAALAMLWLTLSVTKAIPSERNNSNSFLASHAHVR